MSAPAGLERVCATCGKPTARECSRVDCSNRKPVTAQQVGTRSYAPGSDKDGRAVYGDATTRKPHLFDE